jgi:hypothetical protein
MFYTIRLLKSSTPSIPDYRINTYFETKSALGGTFNKIQVEVFFLPGDYQKKNTYFEINFDL